MGFLICIPLANERKWISDWRHDYAVKLSSTWDWKAIVYKVWATRSYKSHSQEYISSFLFWYRVWSLSGSKVVKCVLKRYPNGRVNDCFSTWSLDFSAQYFLDLLLETINQRFKIENGTLYDRFQWKYCIQPLVPRTSLAI